MVSSSPDATGNSCQDSTVGIDALKQLPGIVVLPTVGTPTSVSQRHEVNPLMALKLLQDIQSTVSLWQEQLRQIVQSLRSLEAQGPMVDGWLESSAETAHTTSAHANSQATLFRHGDADTLMRYVDSLDSTAHLGSPLLHRSIPHSIASVS